MRTIEQLSREHAIPGTIDFLHGAGDLVSVTLKRDRENSLDLVLFGAQILSWRHRGEERLFLSKKSAFDGKKAIRGGVPIVFPQFGLGDMPAHGFARIMNWDVHRTARNSDGTLVIVLSLSANDETKKMWGADFAAELEYRLSDTLTTIMRVKNNGSGALEFQNAFHTYFSVADIAHVIVEGLSGKKFLDSTKNREPGTEARATITFDAETDRIYTDAPALVRIVDTKRGGSISIQSTQCRDAVVWNPWVTRCAQITDLEANDYQRYVCIEPGNVCEKINVAPGATWECGQTITCS